MILSMLPKVGLLVFLNFWCCLTTFSWLCYQQQFTNGRSNSSCICTQQGRIGINQDAMIVWEDFMAYKMFFQVFPRTRGGRKDNQTLVFLKNSLDDKKTKGGADHCIGRRRRSDAEMNIEEQLMQVIEKMRIEFENEKKKRRYVEMELEFIKLQLSNE